MSETHAIELVLAALDTAKIRATYEAVGEVIGVHARNVENFLGERRPAASWVVNKRTWLPTRYTQAEMHPELTSNPHIITTATELRRIISEYQRIN